MTALFDRYIPLLDACSTNNGGCSHKCVNSPEGPQCQCEDGYVMRHKKCYGESFCISTTSKDIMYLLLYIILILYRYQ